MCVMVRRWKHVCDGEVVVPCVMVRRCCIMWCRRNTVSLLLTGGGRARCSSTLQGL